MTTLEYFFPDTKNIKNIQKIIKNQGKIVCQYKINPDWIQTHLTESSFGFLSITKRAQIGQKFNQYFTQQYILSGFILCRIPEEKKQIVFIELVCSKQNNKLGKILIETVEKHIKTLLGLKIIRLHSLPDPKLIKWYESQGYIADKPSIKDKNPKVILMEKFL
jgi:hypothetical protein